MERLLFKEMTIKKQVNIEQSQPLIDFYKEKGYLVDINGDQDIDLVFKDIQTILENNH